MPDTPINRVPINQRPGRWNAFGGGKVSVKHPEGTEECPKTLGWRNHPVPCVRSIPTKKRSHPINQWGWLYGSRTTHEEMCAWCGESFLTTDDALCSTHCREAFIAAYPQDE